MDRIKKKDVRKGTMKKKKNEDIVLCKKKDENVDSRRRRQRRLAIQVYVSDRRTCFVYPLETDTIKDLRKMIEEEMNLLSSFVLLNQEGSVLEDLHQPVLKLCSDRVYVSKTLSGWIRYKVQHHDSLKIIALRLGVRRRDLKYFNPGVTLSGDEHRIHRNILLIPANGTLQNLSSSGIERVGATTETCETWHIPRKVDVEQRRAEEMRRELFCAVRREKDERMAELYLKSNGENLELALAAADDDARWETKERYQWLKRGTLNLLQSPCDSFSTKISKLSTLTKRSKSPRRAAGSMNEWQRHNIDRHFRHEMIGNDTHCQSFSCAIQ